MPKRIKQVDLYATDRKLYATGSFIYSRLNSHSSDKSIPLNTSSSQNKEAEDKNKVKLPPVDLNSMNSHRVVPASLGLKVAGSKGTFFGWLSDLFTSFMALFKVTSSEQDIKPFYVDAPTQGEESNLGRRPQSYHANGDQIKAVKPPKNANAYQQGFNYSGKNGRKNAGQAIGEGENFKISRRY